MDPKVRQYMMQKYFGAQQPDILNGADQAVTDAQKQQEMSQFAGIAAGAADNIANAMNQPVVLHNRMQDLGKAPGMVEGRQQKTDMSGVQRMAQDGLKTAQGDRDQALQMMLQQRKEELAQEVATAKAGRDQMNWGLDYNAKQQQMGETARHNKAMEANAGLPKQADPLVELVRQEQLSKLRRDAQQDADSLKVEGYGVANTPDDAKKIKDSIESKSNFDNKLQQLIDLRSSKGGEVMDREAVARGQQLSKDLLLEYKNMQKLGVLSNSDEAIINAIIPSDPLQFNSPLAAIQGQDPILNNMKKFKGDTDSDFQTRVKTRIKADSKPTETKVINGATYQKVQGGWQKVK